MILVWIGCGICAVGTIYNIISAIHDEGDE